MGRKLAIIGGGGHGKVVKEVWLRVCLMKMVTTFMPV